MQQDTTEYGQPQYTTTRGDVVRVEGDHVQVRLAHTTYNSLGFQHHNPNGAANVLAVALEQSYEEGRVLADVERSEARERVREFVRQWEIRAQARDYTTKVYSVHFDPNTDDGGTLTIDDIKTLLGA